MDTLWPWHGPGTAMSILVLTLVFAAVIILMAFWISLPFAVRGLKSTLLDLLEAQRETNRRLGRIESSLEELHRARARGPAVTFQAPEI